MNTPQRFQALSCAMLLLLAAILGCGKFSSGPTPEWTKLRRIAGKQQRLSHVSGLVVDDKFAYVTIGGTVADENEGTNGLRKVALDSGAMTLLDDGQKSPQSEPGGIAIDERFVYWNAGGNILRISRDGGKPETVASDHVGIGVDLAIDNEKVYWTNHSYYSANTPAKAGAIYAAPKKGGRTEIFVDQQNIPNSLVADDKFLYWLTSSSILKQAKSGGQPQVLYQINAKEGLDKMDQDNDNLYFGFRGAGNSRWALRKVSKQGGEPQTIVKTYSLKPVAVDETNIYFFDEDGLTADVFCRVPKNGGEVTRLDTGYSSGVITQSKALVYIASLDTIYGYTK